MTKDTESDIERLVQEAVKDRDLGGFLDAMLDPSRSVSKVMTLRLADLLLSDEETGTPLKWLVWADKNAMKSDLHRMKDYRRRAAHEMNEMLFDFLDVLNILFQTDDPQVSIISTMEMVGSQENQSDEQKERIKEINMRIEQLSKDKNWKKDLLESLMSYILSIVKSGMLTELFIEQPISRFNSLLTSTGLDHSEYTQTLDTLVNFELVSSQFTLFWCDECGPVPRTLIAPYIERPSKLRMTCPNCQTEMKAVSIIEPCFEVIDWLNSNDGLLAILVGYALESKEVTWRANVLEEREIDFLIEKEELDIIIETKVHKIYAESEHEALVSAINNDLCQLATACNTLSEKKKKPYIGALIWNQDIPRKIADNVRLGEPVAKRYDPKKLTVVSLSGIASFMDDISKSSFGK